METLEARTLLSAAAATVFKPTYKLYEPHGKPLLGISPVGGYTPDMIRQAYNVNQITFNGGIVGDGSGQTIAIVDAYDDPKIAQDLHTFNVQFGLPDTTLVKLNENGGTALPGTDPLRGLGATWSLEESLDVEWAHAMAPGAKIILVEATTPFSLFTAVQTAANLPGVSVVSMSFGGPESQADFITDAGITPPQVPVGVTFVASTGDAGAFTAGITSMGVSYPAVSAGVVAVGGTSLFTDANGNYISETAWGNGNQSALLGGGGGGVSRSHLQPVFQQSTLTGNPIFRTVPDLSLVADPATGVAIVDSWDSPTLPWTVIGGTSLSAPLFSGIMAVVNQGRAVAGSAPLDGATQTLPAIYALPSTDFHDITTGSNGLPAGPGYDQATGLGSPITNRFVADLVNFGTTTTPVNPITNPVVGQLTVNASPVTSGTQVTLTASAVTAPTNGGISGVKIYRETNGIAGLQVTDTFVGNATFVTNGTWTLKVSTTGLTSPTNIYYAVATDNTGTQSAATSVVLNLVTPTFTSFTVSPSAVSAGVPVTLSANGVSEASGGKISTVKFYRETNGIPGLQGADLLLGTAKKNGGTYTLQTSTAGFAAGTVTYYAVVTDAKGVTNATSATLTVKASPANDNFANAIALSGATFSITAPNTNNINNNATKEAGEPNHAGRLGGKSLWWTWTAPTTRSVTIDTTGSNFDTLLAVYTGTTLNNLRSVAFNDDANSSVKTSSVTFTAIAGKKYYIAVDAFAGISGDISLNLT